MSVSRRAEDGDVDRVRIERACAGQPVTLSPTELKLAVYRLNVTRGFGVDQISHQLGYARSQVAALLAQYRK